MSLQWVSMFFSLDLIFSKKIFCCSVNPRLMLLRCLAGRSWASSLKLNFFSSSIVFPLRVYSFFAIFCSYLLCLPVLLGAIFPTFRPGGEFLEDCVGIPFACELLPPKGWLTEFIEVPLTIGHSLFLAFIL